MRFNVIPLAVLVFCISGSGFGQVAECTRGEPEPVFHPNNPAVQSVSFKPVSSHEATEEVLFKSGERLTIHNWGCDAFTLSFRWESTSLGRSDPFSQSVEILRKLAAMKADAVFDLSRAANGLQGLIKRGTALKQGELYPVDGEPDNPDFQLKFTLRAVSPTSSTGNRYIEFDLTLGPL